MRCAETKYRRGDRGIRETSSTCDCFYRARHTHRDRCAVERARRATHASRGGSCTVRRVTDVRSARSSCHRDCLRGSVSASPRSARGCNRDRIDGVESGQRARIRKTRSARFCHDRGRCRDDYRCCEFRADRAACPTVRAGNRSINRITNNCACTCGRERYVLGGGVSACGGAGRGCGRRIVDHIRRSKDSAVRQSRFRGNRVDCLRSRNRNG